MRALLSFSNFRLFSSLLVGGFLTACAQGETPLVRLWTPFDRNSQIVSCLKADLQDWMTQDQQGRDVPVPFNHRFVDLPDGRYFDQVRAALDTGEQPHLALIPPLQARDLMLEPDSLFATDLIGLWVDEAALAFLTTALGDLSNLWQSEAASLDDLESFMLLVAAQGEVVLGLDVGARGQDLGLGLLLILDQWTRVRADPQGLNWQDPALAETLAALHRWTQEGLVAEIDLAARIDAGGLPPLMTLGPYSSGQSFGAGFAFYPLFSRFEEQPAAYQFLPMHWHTLRPEDEGILAGILTAIDTNEVFETCGEAAGLLPRLQWTLDAPALGIGEEVDTDDLVEEDGQTNLMARFTNRRSNVLSADLTVRTLSEDGLDAALQAALANAYRDIRAGLSLENAIANLAAASQ